MDAPFDDEAVDSFEDQEPDFSVHDPGADGEVADDDDPLSAADIERLYKQALQAMEFADAVEEQIGFEEAGESEREGEAAAPDSDERDSADAAPIPDVTPRQIIEAALFVGGTALTIKKLSRLLSDDLPDDFVEREVEELNELYERQDRPYRVAFGEGGYRMELQSDFERIRNRVYGVGPKDVRLSQDALEVLAMVAYRQPVARETVEAAGKKNSGSMLNQLLRRELISLERTGKSRRDVEYRTTPRFLQLFGLADLSDLPQPEDLSFK